jgi:nitroreductase
MNPVLEAIQTRRSIRCFAEKKIPHQELEEIVEAGRWAPTGMNRQQCRFTVVQDKALIERLAKAMRTELQLGGEYCFYHADALVLVSNERDNALGVQDCSCALQNIFLAAHALGVGSVWINQLSGACDRAAIRKVLDDLKIPQHHVIYGLAALGYAEGPAPRAPERKEPVEWFLA